MKRILGILTIIIVSACFTVQAQPKANTWYGKADLGGSWLQDTEVTELFGPVIGDNEVKFDPGVRAGFGGGYNVTDWFAGEFEMGMSWNNVDKIGAANPLDAMYINVPFLVNAKLQLPNPSIIRPYIGAGAGGSSSVLDIDHLSYGNISLYGSASDVTFTWQGFAGVQFAIAPNMNLGVEYRYVWVTGPDFGIDWGWYYNIETDEIAFDDIEVHSVSFVFSYQF